MLIKDAILDGHIENNYDAAYDFMIEKAKEIGIYPKNLKILISQIIIRNS